MFTHQFLILIKKFKLFSIEIIIISTCNLLYIITREFQSYFLGGCNDKTINIQNFMEFIPFTIKNTFTLQISPCVINEVTHTSDYAVTTMFTQWTMSMCLFQNSLFEMFFSVVTSKHFCSTCFAYSFLKLAITC